MIAEGVETAEQLSYIEQRCDSYQGYHLSKPLLAGNSFDSSFISGSTDAGRTKQKQTSYRVLHRMIAQGKCA